MLNDLTKTFFDTFGIECNIHFHQQFNGAQVPRGLEFYKEREKLEKEGIIKIWHKMLNPRPENDCIYWGEYHYPQITDRHYLELICMVMNIFDGIRNVYVNYSVEKVKERTLKLLITAKDDVYSQVQAIFEGER